MDIVAPTTTTRKPDFVVVALAADISPYMLGALDAERGEIACPEMYFTRQGDMCEYCEGFEAVAGASLTTRHFLGSPTAVTAVEVEATLDTVFAPVVDDSQPLSLFDYDGELEDQIEGRLDNEWHSRGQW